MKPHMKKSEVMAVKAIRIEDGFDLLMQQSGFVSGLQDNHCELRKKARFYLAFSFELSSDYRKSEM
jgi:hypothetical protein